ncbi:response regulator [Kitasatospora atroaurantiaca]|uniref:Transcriptional regulatory protein n=1 Tax=Kitasatospora atroaurantiaca TaxID=285545 RepID=A0A561EY99_9ACTN|nr:response regulator [Kitasatospora atroaurantiaca]TWE20588.1 response regulator of citrate/malate metabolism [Kitasatospora atroaurantiaca]
MIDVLVVEDDPVAAAAHTLYVQRVPGFRVAGTVHTCADALRLLDRARAAGTPVDLALLDLYLPDGHGLSLCRTLRAAGHGTDIIAVTSARDLAMVRQAVSAGVVQYLLKPFSSAALNDRLERYARYRDTLARTGEATGQDEVDQAFAVLRTPDRSALPKGLSAPTLEAVATVLREASEGLSSAAAGAAAGVSRITARRYLEHLVDTGLAVREPQYGQVGRPELCYRWRVASSR